MPCPDFYPRPSLLDSVLGDACRASVIVPARNEEPNLPATLDALRRQSVPGESLLSPELYEVILLLNNCTDSSADVAYQYQRTHPAFQLHVVERSFPPEDAHVGMARRLLMDTAWHRLKGSSHLHTAILSTDADTIVAPDWIVRNLRAIEAGAEVVGGVIHLNPADIRHLEPGILHAYRQDRRYQRRVARLESLLDPDPADPWPRHLEHFGASLACTPAVYARAGGLPPIKPLEDVAFIEACRRVDARIRHAPEVSITTSARLNGRAEVGLSGQLRLWQQDCLNGSEQRVQSANYLAHRFNCLGHLRRLCVLPVLPPLPTLPQCWRKPVADMHPLRLTHADFLAAIDCNRLIDQTFNGPREDTIQHAIPALSRAIARASKCAPERPAETSPAAAIEQFAIHAG